MGRTRHQWGHDEALQRARGAGVLVGVHAGVVHQDGADVDESDLHHFMHHFEVVVVFTF